MSGGVNWDKPIEVWCEGEWFPASVAEYDDRESSYPYKLAYRRLGQQWFDAKGRHCFASDYVRNVAAETAGEP